jgi:hypothetical protein
VFVDASSETAPVADERVTSQAQRMTATSASQSFSDVETSQNSAKRGQGFRLLTDSSVLSMPSKLQLVTSSRILLRKHSAVHNKVTFSNTAALDDLITISKEAPSSERWDAISKRVQATSSPADDVFVDASSETAPVADERVTSQAQRMTAASASQSYSDLQAALHQAQSPRAPASAAGQSRGLHASGRWDAISKRVQATSSPADDIFQHPEA